MLNTVETSLEILGGLIPKLVNIRLDHADKNLIKSLAKQVFRGTALTDRQLDVSLKKIEKYRDGLEKNSVDVDSLLKDKTTRMPLREIDRSRVVSLVTGNDKKVKISVKFVFSKKFATLWGEISKNLIGSVETHKRENFIRFNEKDLHFIVNKLEPEGFEISQEIREIYEEIEKILKFPSDYAPHVSLEDGKPILKNANSHCIEYMEKEFPVYKDEDFLSFIARLKNCGIYHKNPEIIKKINQECTNDLVKSVLVNTTTRFRINPQEYGTDTVFDIINTIKEWPILIVLDEAQDPYPTVQSTVDELLKFIDRKDINVFFRLDNNTDHGKEFNQFVKDNHLNNFIGTNTKVVFITKNKIPKPLMNADWTPRAAVLFSNYEYGKAHAFLNSIPSLYYYNIGLNNKFNQRKGKYRIVQL